MAGKKQEVIRDETLYIRVSKKELEDIKKIAKEIDLPVASFARNLLLYAKEDASFFSKIGLFKGVKKLQDWKIIAKQNNDEE